MPLGQHALIQIRFVLVSYKIFKSLYKRFIILSIKPSIILLLHLFRINLEIEFFWTLSQSVPFRSLFCAILIISNGEFTVTPVYFGCVYRVPISWFYVQYCFCDIILPSVMSTLRFTRTVPSIFLIFCVFFFLHLVVIFLQLQPFCILHLQSLNCDKTFSHSLKCLCSNTNCDATFLLGNLKKTTRIRRSLVRKVSAQIKLHGISLQTIFPSCCAFNYSALLFLVFRSANPSLPPPPRK